MAESSTFSQIRLKTTSWFFQIKLLYTSVIARKQLETVVFFISSDTIAFLLLHCGNAQRDEIMPRFRAHRYYIFSCKVAQKYFSLFLLYQSHIYLSVGSSSFFCVLPSITCTLPLWIALPDSLPLAIPASFSLLEHISLCHRQRPLKSVVFCYQFILLQLQYIKSNCGFLSFP